ncbi:MAG: YezD family protein [Actinomycetota bacterium]|nr:YezD family protein [Actinomycetota bacterium]
MSDDATSTPTTTDEQLAHLSPEERDVLAKVTEIVRRIQFGTVVLVIQDGKVVQIEMAEKFRLR